MALKAYAGKTLNVVAERKGKEVVLDRGWGKVSLRRGYLSRDLLK